MKYLLEIIPGTAEYVQKELTEKYPEVRIEQIRRETILFESEFEDVDEFRNLFSPLRIKKENGLIRNLFRREWKVATASAGINPSLAYIMCMIADVNTDDTVFDPFCGAGTIPLTAAIYFKPKKVWASDKSGPAIDMTIDNIKAADFPKNIFVAFRSNFEQIHMPKGSISKIISNLPFGIRVGSHADNVKLYEAIAAKSEELLEQKGSLVLLTLEKELIEKVFKNTKFKIIKRVTVAQGGLDPTIYVLRRGSSEVVK